jgi:hypothetical protein
VLFIRIGCKIKIAVVLLKFEVTIPCFSKAIFKTIRPFDSLGSFNQVCEEGKIVTLGDKGITVDSNMSRVKQIRKYPSVTSQLSVNITNIIILFAVKTIIVIVTALIRAEFFIRPAEKFSSAVKTYSFHSVMF